MKKVIICIVITVALFGLYIAKKPNNTSSVKQQKDIPQQKQQVIPTSQACNGKATPEVTEGPYYKEGSPERTNIRENAEGVKLTVTGIVFDQFCNPIANAWLDFWQADGSGKYDNEGYTLRGHQYTDEAGRYILETVIPGEYPGRTEHIHVKVSANETNGIMTTQLFFPGTIRNKSDTIFNEALLLDIADAQDGKAGTYNFIIPITH